MSTITIDVQELSASELASGLVVTGEKRTCVVCEAEFVNGIIYTVDETQMTAELAARRHVEVAHGGMLGVLLALPDGVSGITKTQKTLIESMAAGVSDGETARRMGGIAASTVRNHRYQYRRRLSEAKVQVAVGELVAAQAGLERYVEYPAGMPMADDRVVTTEQEASRIASRLFESGKALSLTRFPRKEKEKLVVLRRIALEFEAGREYTEREINEILGGIYHDYVTIRRYLIEYRFLSRKPDGSAYWVPEA